MEDLENCSNTSEVHLMKAIIHNKVLLMIILSKLGMSEDEIDEVNATIYNEMDKAFEEVTKEIKGE